MELSVHSNASPVFDQNDTKNELGSSAFMLASQLQKVTLIPTDSWAEDTSSSCTQVSCLMS